MSYARAGRQTHIFRPFFFESIKFGLGYIGGWGAVNPAQVGGHHLAVLPGAEVQRMAHQMYDAGLDHRVREGFCNRLGEAFQTIHDGDQDVLDAPVLQLVHNRESEIWPFVLGDPQAQKFTLAITGDAEDDVDGLVLDRPAVCIADLHT
jgi:hypothetical protein